LPRAAHRQIFTPALLQDTVLAPRFERHPFQGGIGGEGTNIDIR
jgi:hypothetical protein